jgi:hypothetical protein
VSIVRELGIYAGMLVIGAGIVGVSVAVGTHADQRAKQAVSVAPAPAGPDSLPAYSTLEEAGTRAIARAYQCSHVYECGGVIAQRPDGKYVVGPVRSDYSGDSVEIAYGVPMGYKLAADYHIHPCLPQSHHVAYFSPADTSNNIARHLIGFMGDLCTGKVHEFDPLTMKPDTDTLEDGLYLTQGKIVGQISVDGTKQEPNTGL